MLKVPQSFVFDFSIPTVTDLPKLTHRGVYSPCCGEVDGIRVHEHRGIRFSVIRVVLLL